MIFKKPYKILITSIFLTIFSLFCYINQGLANSSSQEDSALSTSALHPKQQKWNFDGFFGTVDKQSAQRGFQIYKEVCSACHSINLVAYRNLASIGFEEKEIKQIASEYLVSDGPNEDGDMFDRPGLPSDHLVPPYPNENAARSANGGALPPDLSLIIKSRHDGANYVYSLLTGYQDAPEDFPMTEGKNYNPYFEGRQISMPAPLTEGGQIEYQDGTFSAKEQMAVDIVNFLQWVSEPEMEKRKKMGIRAMSFLGIMLVIALAAKKAVWQQVK